MWYPNNLQWWILIVVALLIVFVWPPVDDKSLAVKFVNWAVDPKDELPVLPPQLGLGQGDDPVLVYERDLITQQYDSLYSKGGWTRKRLELKVWDDPFNPSTERQLLAGLGVVTAFVVWRLAGSRQK
jgi:hypothetical protein